ncbi:MAG: carboxypeptidase-like regulatory domain-containing protein [Haliscomenobacter sp.]|nr:carboxypeptidase-like regulatory domain-containing protein [Haliscomenobacter sp.]
MKTPNEGNDLLRRWLEGSANRFEENRLDEAASHDPFLAEAMEGYRHLESKDHEASLRALNKRLSRRSRPSISWATGLRAAAAVAVLVVVAWAVWRITRPLGPSNSLAQDAAPLDKIQQEAPAPAPSSTPEAKKAPEPAIASKTKKATPAKPAPSPMPSEEPVKILDLPSAFKEETEAEASRKEEATAFRSAASRAPAIMPLQGTLTGKVIDEQGNPLPNVDISWENQGLATRSDAEGNFLIPQDAGSKTLVFSKDGKTTSFMPREGAPFTVVLGNQAGHSVAMTRSTAKFASPESPKAAPVVKTPAPEGGFPALNNYIQRNLRYPALALQSRVEGGVAVEFSIPASGIPSDFKLLENPGYGLDLEAIRLLENGPKWVAAFPGQRYVYTVVFKLP